MGVYAFFMIEKISNVGKAGQEYDSNTSSKGRCGQELAWMLVDEFVWRCSNLDSSP